MRPNAKARLQVLGMHQQAHEFIHIVVKAEEHAYSHIVAAAFLGAVHGLGMPLIIALWPRGMQLEIPFPVVGLLEKDIGSDSGFLKLPVILNRRGGDIHVHAADVAVFVMHAVDCLDTLENILNRVVDRVLAGLDGKSLMPHVLKGNDFRAHFILCQLFSRNVSVFDVIRAVNAAVDAVVRKV